MYWNKPMSLLKNVNKIEFASIKLGNIKGEFICIIL